MKQVGTFTALMFGASLATHAAINFHISQASNNSHGDHQVRAVVTIQDKANNEMVTTVGGYDAFHQGLLVGQEHKAKWEAGWVFRRNISGYYGFYFGCNVDGRQYIEPTHFPMIYVADNTDVEVSVTCPLTPEGSLLDPKVEIHQKTKG